MKQDISAKITEKDFENLIDAHFTPTEMAKDCFELAQKMVAQSLQPNIVGEGEKVYSETELQNQIKESEHWHNEEIIRLGGIISDLKTVEENYLEILQWIKKEKETPKNISDHKSAYDRLVKIIQSKEITLPIQPLQKGKSIEECKELASKELNYANYPTIAEDIYNGVADEDMLDKLINKTVLFYASQHPLQNGRGYTEEQIRKAIIFGTAIVGLDGKVDTKKQEEYILSLTPASTEKKIDEQKILDTLRFTWRNLNRTIHLLSHEFPQNLILKKEKEKLKIVHEKIDEALNEFVVTPPSNQNINL